MGVWTSLMCTITLVRGISGSGKTSFVNEMTKETSSKSVAADDWFYSDGEYLFDPSKLPDAHAWCLAQAKSTIESGNSIVVHNTFTQRWEMEPYLSLARKSNVRVFVVSIYDGGHTDEELFERNSHGVPLSAIRTMRQRFEHDWANGNPVPPWDR